MSILRYLRGHGVAVALIIALLIAQAFLDLSLPRFTSDIVDVGIQQSGVSDAAPSEMRAGTFDAVAMMLSDADEATLRAAYQQTEAGTYALTDAGRQERATLDRMVAFPMAVVFLSSQATGAGDADASGTPADAGSGAGAGAPDLADLVAAYDAGMVGKDQVAAMLDEARATLSISDDLIDQQGVAAAKAEYEALGYDMGAMETGYVLRSGGLMLALVAGGVVVSVIENLLATRTGASVGRTLRKRMYARVVAFSDADIQRFSAASLITRATNDIQQIQTMTVMTLRMLAYAPILAVGGVIQVARTDLSMGWVIGIGVLAVAVVVSTLMVFVMPKFKVMQRLIDRVNQVAREMLTGVSVVRAFGRQDHEQRRFEQANEDLWHTQLFTNRAMSLMMPLMMLIMNGISVLVVWVGGHYVDAGQIQTGDLIAFISYAMVIISSFLILGMLSVMIPRAEVAAGRINEVLDTEPSVADPLHPVALPAPAAGAPVPAGAAIAFDHVDFSYADSEEPVLRDVTFTAPAGKVTAIVGSTGSGKSTIVKLVERFYDVTAGAVTVDGVDVRDLRQHDLRAQLGYVPQKAFLFSGTIASNIAYGAPGASPERVAEAARVAQAADFIAERPEGAGAPIAQGGTNVSGGQRQRLAIARALATDARAYLFDDSFSALDYRTDAALRQALATEMRGRTVLIVAQRIATVLHADVIVVLDEGRVVGTGTHAELMRDCPQYREIALSQLSEAELAAAAGAADGAGEGTVTATTAADGAGEKGGDAR